jgi:hypothetical protein
MPAVGTPPQPSIQSDHTSPAAAPRLGAARPLFDAQLGLRHPRAVPQLGKVCVVFVQLRRHRESRIDHGCSFWLHFAEVGFLEARLLLRRQFGIEGLGGQDAPASQGNI